MKLFNRELTIDELINLLRAQTKVSLPIDCRKCCNIEAALELADEVERLRKNIQSKE